MDLQANVAAGSSRSARSRQAIIRAATEVFLQHGYLGATTDEVAAERVGIQADGLQAVRGQAAPVRRGHPGHDGPRWSDELSEPPRTRWRTRRTCARPCVTSPTASCDGLLQPDVLRLRRLVIAEADRFPEVGRAWFDRGFDRALVILGESMQRLADRGLLRDLGDPTLAAYQFAGLVMYQPMNQAMFAGTERTPARRPARPDRRRRGGRLPRRLRVTTVRGRKRARPSCAHRLRPRVGRRGGGAARAVAGGGAGAAGIRRPG